jgi:hypothetical protein
MMLTTIVQLQSKRFSQLFQPTMKVAIAGSGDLAQLIARTVQAHGYDLHLLTRGSESEFQTAQVDYTLQASLHMALKDVDTLISTVTSATAELALIDACLTARVRRFAPAEFEGVLDTRPLASSAASSGRFDVLNRLREERHRLDSTVFVCGILMERFSPGGWGGNVREGEFLIDVRNATARIPVSGNENDAKVCLTAARDMAEFVACCISLPVWPEQLRCYGERLNVRQIVETAEQVRHELVNRKHIDVSGEKSTRSMWERMVTRFPWCCGRVKEVEDNDNEEQRAEELETRKFSTTEISWEELQDGMLDAEECGDAEEEERLDLLLAVQRGEFDFVEVDMNAEFRGVRVLALREWLIDAWSGVELS